MTAFEHLFTPITIGNVRLKNRIYSSGHIPAYAETGILAHATGTITSRRPRVGSG